MCRPASHKPPAPPSRVTRHRRLSITAASLESNLYIRRADDCFIPTTEMSSDSQDDPEFPPIRIGNDPPMILQPLPPPPHPSRYHPKPAPESKIQKASNQKIRSGGIFDTSRAFNKPSSPDPGKTKKVNLQVSFHRTQSLLRLAAAPRSTSGKFTPPKAAARV